MWSCVPFIVFSYCLLIRCNHWRWSLITLFARHDSSPGWYGQHTIYNHHFQARTCEGCWQVIWGDTQKQGEPCQCCLQGRCTRFYRARPKNRREHVFSMKGQHEVHGTAVFQRGMKAISTPVVNATALSKFPRFAEILA